MSRYRVFLALTSVYCQMNVLMANDFGGTPSTATECTKCHGLNGHSTAPDIPNLAGQNRLYLDKQITAFLNGTRTHPVIGTDDADPDGNTIDNSVTYYANLELEEPLQPLNTDGETVYSGCASCHGDNGEGIAPFPRLMGQKPEYLEQQLVNFKTGARQNAVMQAMTINLSDQEIKSLANYLGVMSNPIQSSTRGRVSYDPFYQ